MQDSICASCTFTRKKNEFLDISLFIVILPEPSRPDPLRFLSLWRAVFTCPGTTVVKVHYGWKEKRLFCFVFKTKCKWVPSFCGK
jgi:hypothetical protein